MKKKTKPKKENEKKLVENYHSLKGASKWRYNMTGGRMK
jgi:hypothetical protein